jgi:hypothetical protein
VSDNGSDEATLTREQNMLAALKLVPSPGSNFEAERRAWPALRSS